MPVISTSNARHYLWGGQCDGWHLVQSPHLSVIQERVPPGCSEKRHFHHKAEQFFYVLSGTASIEVNGEIHQLNPNQGLHVPAGIPHQLSNQQQQDLVFIVTSTPPSHGDRVEV